MKKLILLILLFSSCYDNPITGERFDSIGILNNSTDTIFVYVADSESLNQYPDTSLPLEKPNLTPITPDRRFGYTIRKRFWEEEFKLLLADTLSIFILDDEVCRDSSWSSIRDNYQILNRYDLSYQNVEYLGFNIPYPPTQWMIENVKMYP